MEAIKGLQNPHLSAWFACPQDAEFRGRQRVRDFDKRTAKVCPRIYGPLVRPALLSILTLKGTDTHGKPSKEIIVASGPPLGSYSPIIQVPLSLAQKISPPSAHF